MAKNKDINELSVKDLTERVAAEKEQLNRLKVQHAVSPVENPAVLKKSRRDIARMLTTLRQKQNS